MSGYEKAKGRSKPGFIMIRHDIMKSSAWLSLSPKSVSVYAQILFRYNGVNNGEIPLGCREAGELCNIGKNTANRAFRELEDKGFIKIGTHGGFRVKKRYTTRWILTHESYGGCKPTNEWRKWKSVSKI